MIMYISRECFLSVCSRWNWRSCVWQKILVCS